MLALSRKPIQNQHPEHVAVLSINHDEALLNPASTATVVNLLLGGEMDDGAIAAAIEPTLRTESRERSGCTA